MRIKNWIGSMLFATVSLLGYFIFHSDGPVMDVQTFSGSDTVMVIKSLNGVWQEESIYKDGKLLFKSYINLSGELHRIKYGEDGLSDEHIVMP